MSQADETKPDLTPMIDIVFNLIIFFLIVSELSNLSLEQVQLAYASEAREQRDEDGAEKVLHANVLASGEIKIRGARYSDRAADQGRFPSLRQFLELEAASCPREAPPAGSVEEGPSTLRLNLRVDRDAPFEHVQRVLAASSANGVVRTSFAATQESPETR